jgi:hypothetical protein
MVDVTELRSTANHLLWFARNKQAEFSAALVIAKLVHPILALLDAMQTNRGERWRTLSEAMNDTGLCRNYFEKPLASLGRRSRLEVWREEGLADRAGEEGIWLISPIKVTEAKNDGAEQEVPGTESSEGEPAPGEPSTEDLAERIAREFLKVS